MWIVATNNFYYPDVVFFKSYEQAKEFYENTINLNAGSLCDKEGQLTVVIAEVKDFKSGEDEPHDCPWYCVDEGLLGRIKGENV